MLEGTERYLKFKMYEPREDSFLLLKYVEKYSDVDLVLDMGTGTGIQANCASEKSKKVYAADIDPEAIKYAKTKYKKENIKYIESDLFEKIPEKEFDLIIFNPPYLPEEKNIEDIALFSGKRGVTTTLAFLDQCSGYLKKQGVILLIVSSLASQSKIDETIKKNLLEKKVLEKVHIFFEDIIVLKLSKSSTLKKLESENIKKPKVFSHGKRGVIIKGTYESQTVAVKIKKKESFALGTIDNEARFMKLLNKYDIGPRFIMHKKNFLMYKFVSGIFIEEFVISSKKKDILSVLKKVFYQMYVMDNLGINKFEMHHPIKHIVIKDNNPVLLDFERCRRTEDPKNVTQFCDFLISKKFNSLLKKKEINIEKNQMIRIAKKYKGNRNKKNFEEILSLL